MLFSILNIVLVHSQWSHQQKNRQTPSHFAVPTTHYTLHTDKKKIVCECLVNIVLHLTAVKELAAAKIDFTMQYHVEKRIRYQCLVYSWFLLPQSCQNHKISFCGWNDIWYLAFRWIEFAVQKEELWINMTWQMMTSTMKHCLWSKSCFWPCRDVHVVFLCPIHIVK